MSEAIDQSSEVEALQRRLTASQEMFKASNKLTMRYRHRMIQLEVMVDEYKTAVLPRLEQHGRLVEELEKQKMDAEVYRRAALCTKCVDGYQEKGFPCEHCQSTGSVALAFDICNVNCKMLREKVTKLEEELAALRQDYDVLQIHLHDSEGIRIAEKEILLKEISDHAETKRALVAAKVRRKSR